MNERGEPEQIIFMDYIIRLTLCRATVNYANRKFVTALKLLENGEEMILFVRESSQRFYRILIDEEATEEEMGVRCEAEIIPIDILA